MHRHKLCPASVDCTRVALPTPARFKFIPEVRCLKFDASTPYTLASPAPLEQQGPGRKWAGDLFVLVPADPKTDGTARVGYMVEVKVLGPAEQQKPRKGVLGAALQQVLKYQLIDHDIGPVDLRFVVLLGRLVVGTNAMTKHEAFERLKKEGGFKKPKKKVDTKWNGGGSQPTMPRPPVSP